MRYFRTTNASRQYRAGDIVVTFEPVDNIGGSWSGLLAADEPAASKLAGAALPQVTEITKEEYDGLKKKPPTLNPSFRDSVRPPHPFSPQLPVVGPAVAPSAATPSNKAAPVAPQAQVKAAKLEVPDELKLEAAPTKRRK